MRKLVSMESDAKGLWSVFWRMLLFAPMVGIFGSLFLVLLLGLEILPLFALIFLFAGEYFYCLMGITIWLGWRSVRKRAWKLAGEGWDQAGL